MNEHRAGQTVSALQLTAPPGPCPCGLPADAVRSDRVPHQVCHRHDGELGVGMCLLPPPALATSCFACFGNIAPFQQATTGPKNHCHLLTGNCTPITGAGHHRRGLPDCRPPRHRPAAAQLPQCLCQHRVVHAAGGSAGPHCTACLLVGGGCCVLQPPAHTQIPTHPPASLPPTCPPSACCAAQVIQLACLSLSVFWGLLSGTLYYLLRPAGKELYHTGNSVALGVLSGVAALFVLSFLGGVLLRWGAWVGWARLGRVGWAGLVARGGAGCGVLGCLGYHAWGRGAPLLLVEGLAWQCGSPSGAVLGFNQRPRHLSRPAPPARSVLDATFMCWAIDRDSQTVSRPDVYEVTAATD